MTIERLVTDSEIDYNALMKTLWDGRLIICAFFVVGVVFGAWHSHDRIPTYRVSTPLDVKIFAVRAHVLCGALTSCMEDETIKMVSSSTLEDWQTTKNRPSLWKLTSQPLSVGEYEVELQRINSTLTDEVHLEAEFITSKYPSQNSAPFDPVYNNLKILAALTKRTIKRGDSVLDFGTVSIKKETAGLPAVIALSAFTGLAIGVFVTLIVALVRKLKTN